MQKIKRRAKREEGVSLVVRLEGDITILVWKVATTVKSRECARW